MTMDGTWTSNELALRAAAAQFIRDFERLDQPGHHPGGSSGVTLPIGYDLGYVTPQQFAADWGQVLDPKVFARLKRAVGVKGAGAVALCPQFRDIKVTARQAETVFEHVMIPRFIDRTRKAFPGFDSLPQSARVALVSLVYNRGEGMGVKGKPSWDARREMREIRDRVELYEAVDGARRGVVLVEIAEQFRKMERLWEGKGLSGLIRRRRAEADLVLAGVGK